MCCKSEMYLDGNQLMDNCRHSLFGVQTFLIRSVSSVSPISPPSEPFRNRGLRGYIPSQPEPAVEHAPENHSKAHTDSQAQRASAVVGLDFEFGKKLGWSTDRACEMVPKL